MAKGSRNKSKKSWLKERVRHGVSWAQRKLRSQDFGAGTKVMR